MSTEGGKTPEFRRKHERSLYFNEERLDAFEAIAGETILVEKTDVRGNPYQETLTIPEDINGATYLAFDMLVDFVKSRIPVEEA